jgi:GAF domain-containing protein
MFTLPAPSNDPQLHREEILASIRLLTDGESNLVANCANVASVLFHVLDDVNWAGFYLWDGTELVLGPFHGKPACLRIALGRGVCGTAALERRTVVVEDVEAFPGHIACDSASRSEVVIPLVRDEVLIGVLDVDSPVLSRFAPQDVDMLESVAQILMSR